MHCIGLVVYHGFQPLGLSLASVFEHAQLKCVSSFYQILLLSENGGLVTCSQGYAVDTLNMYEHQIDTIIVLGHNNNVSPPTPKLLAYLREHAAHSKRIAAICTGALILAEAGLLNQRRATTHWAIAQRFKNLYPDVQLEEDKIYVIDGQIWTSAGMTACIDLSLAMLEEDLGIDIARQVARMLLVYQRRGGGQSQFSQLLELDAKSDRIQTVLTYASAHLSQDLSVDILADIAHLSSRQFSRVFHKETGQTPAKAIERLRVESARILLENSNHSLDVIAKKTGFGDRERMRQSFLRAFGQTPQAIQRSTRK